MKFLIRPLILNILISATLTAHANVQLTKGVECYFYTDKSNADNIYNAIKNQTTNDNNQKPDLTFSIYFDKDESLEGQGYAQIHDIDIYWMSVSILDPVSIAVASSVVDEFNRKVFTISTNTTNNSTNGLKTSYKFTTEFSKPQQVSIDVGGVSGLQDYWKVCDSHF